MLLYRTFLLAVLTTTHLLTRAGGDNFPIGARSNALGNAAITLRDVYAASNNQAGLAYLTTPRTAVYHQRRFMLPELSLNSAVAALPVSSGVFGLSVTRFGFSAYNDSKVGIGFAKKLLDNLAGGIQVDLLSTSIAGYGSRFAITFEAGILAEITEELHFGVHIYNPTRASLGEGHEEAEKTPAILRAGLSYRQKGNYLIALEVEKDIDFPPVLKAGIEYLLTDFFSLRAGISTGVSSYSFGGGLAFDNLEIAISGAHHQYLGFTPSISIQYFFDKKDER